MNEEITVEYNSLKIMKDEALDFFLDELQARNFIRISDCPDSQDIIIKTKQDWNELLTKLNIGSRSIKKDYRI